MKKYLSLIVLLFFTTIVTEAQERFGDDGFTMVDGQEGGRFNTHAKKDSTAHKEIPKGIFEWIVDSRFGDRTMVDRDTLQHLYMNSYLTTGKYGQYNTTGNLGAPRINRIFTDNKPLSNFIFANPFDFVLKRWDEIRFTNTLSPITTINYASCGDKIDGEDFLQVKFAVNASKRLGFGMLFDYFYGRGYYANQSSSLFNWKFWESYIGERYQNHFVFSTHHLKNTENGGITNDEYITHPESFNDKFQASEIPTVLNNNYNQLDGKHIFLTHRYNVGFYKKVPMTDAEIEARKFAIKSEQERLEKERQAKEQNNNESKDVKSAGRQFGGRPSDAKVVGDLLVDSITGKIDSKRIAVNDSIIADSLLANTEQNLQDTAWVKDEYVPVTSFFHTLKFDTYKRIYHGNFTPQDFYATSFETIDALEHDNIYDRTNHLYMHNTVGVSLLEGFNKWAKSGLKVFAAHQYEHYELPDTVAAHKSYNQSTVYLGGQLLKTQGRTLHYDASAEFGAVGANFGEFMIDFNGDVNIPLFGDTTSVILNGYFHELHPDFLMEKYHSEHFWWDIDDMKSILRTHLEGSINVKKTKTTLRLAYDNIENYTYFGLSYNKAPNTGNVTNYQITPRQTSENISLITAELYQDFRLGILNWENRITFQKSSNEIIVPVPKLNLWSNLYIDFKIAKVLSCHLGGEMTYFTEYNAPEYSGQLSTFAIQENENVRTSIGNYPFVSVYANFVLKGCRFYAMMTHVNAGNGNRRYFTTPHFPMNERVFRIGLSWNVFN